MDIEHEISLIRESVATLRERCDSISERMELGDTNIRQGIEMLKGNLINLQVDLTQIARNSFGAEGKQALKDDIREIKSELQTIKKDLKNLERNMVSHGTEHALVEGGRRRSDAFQERWLAPIIIGILVGAIVTILTVVLN